MGISGSGASAVAGLAKAKGYEVSGCDEENGGHVASHINNIDLLCVTPSVFYTNNNHPEILAAKDKKIPIITWQEFMGKILFKDYFTIAIAGTHGKTTTTGLLGFMLEQLGFDPWVEVGGIVKNWGKNYRVGKSNYFVCEADEFYNNFLNIHADIILLNNIELDHPEFFDGKVEKMYESFVRFINGMKAEGKLIVNTDNKGITQLLNCPIAKNINIVKIDNDFINENRLVFKDMQIFGEQNVKNAAGVLKICEKLKIEKEKIIPAIQNFKGMKRRQDLIGEVKGVKIFDDYAHHPTAIRETLRAFRDKFPKEKLICVIEPHTYSRMKYLFEDFLTCADGADLAIYTDTFESRERGKPTATSRDLVGEIKKDNVQYASFNEVVDYLINNVEKNSVVVFMGAGNVNKISKKYYQTLTQKI